MGYQGKVYCLIDKPMQLWAIIHRGLIDFKDQNPIGKVKQDYGDCIYKIEDRYNTAEGQSNKDNGNKESVSLLNRVNVVVVE